MSVGLSRSGDIRPCRYVSLRAAMRKAVHPHALFTLHRLAAVLGLPRTTAPAAVWGYGRASQADRCAPFACGCASGRTRTSGLGRPAARTYRCSLEKIGNTGQAERHSPRTRPQIPQCRARFAPRMFKDLHHIASYIAQHRTAPGQPSSRARSAPPPAAPRAASPPSPRAPARGSGRAAPPRACATAPAR